MPATQGDGSMASCILYTAVCCLMEASVHLAIAHSAACCITNIHRPGQHSPTEHVLGHLHCQGASSHTSSWHPR